MMPAKEFTQLDDVVVTLPHLLAVDGDHVVVQPIPGRYLMIAHGTLRDLALVMRELQIHPATMYIEPLTQILVAHGRAFYMPTRKAHAPGTLPLHDMLRRRMLPKRKITFVALFVLSRQCPGRLKLVIQHTTAQHAVSHTPSFEIAVVFFHVKIHRTIYYIGIPVSNDPLDHNDLLYNMTGGSRLDARLQIVKLLHRPVEHIGVLLNQLHGLKLFQHRLGRDFILRHPALLLEMPGIRNVSDIPDLVAQLHQVTK